MAALLAPFVPVLVLVAIVYELGKLAVIVTLRLVQAVVFLLLVAWVAGKLGYLLATRQRTVAGLRASLTH
jgi:hypothetical protein